MKEKFEFLNLMHCDSKEVIKIALQDKSERRIRRTWNWCTGAGVTPGQDLQLVAWTVPTIYGLILTLENTGSAEEVVYDDESDSYISPKIRKK